MSQNLIHSQPIHPGNAISCRKQIRDFTQAPPESPSKPGIKMVYPEPCKELRRRPQLLIAEIVPY